MDQLSSLTVARARAALLTDDPRQILSFAADGFDAGEATVLVTLTEVRGGSARAPGAHMAVRADGLYCGLVSGGCVEAAVVAEALAAMRHGMDRVVRFGAGSGIFDIALPCGGGITLSLHVLRESAVLRAVLGRLAARRPAALLYCPATQTLTQVAHPPGELSPPGAFLRAYRPDLRICLAGTGPETELIARLAHAAGYAVTTAPEYDGETAAVFLHHDLEREIPRLADCLASDAFYIGALGSARTHAARVERLRRLGIDATSIGRIRAPIGLFGPARDSTTLAFSVLAEIGKKWQERSVSLISKNPDNKLDKSCYPSG